MIQIIGKTGMLGSEILKKALRRNIKVVESYVDILTVVPDDIKAGIVINCAAITTPNTSKEMMIQVNQHGPRRLAHACDECGSRLLHISSDAVFNRPGPHPERDFCDPSSSYGRTKMNGEIRHGKHLTVRTSFVGFGRHGIVEQLMNTDDVIQASDRFLWSGHIVSVIADIVIDLAQNESITGLIHIPGEFQSRYSLLMRLIDIMGISSDRVERNDNWVTDRRLVSTRWNPIGLEQPPTFEDQLVELYHEYANLCRNTSRSNASPQRMVT